MQEIVKLSRTVLDARDRKALTLATFENIKLSFSEYLNRVFSIYTSKYIMEMDFFFFFMKETYFF